MRQQLIAEGLELEEVGGSVQVVETAATKGTGLLQLEEALIMQVCLHTPLAITPHYRGVSPGPVESCDRCVHRNCHPDDAGTTKTSDESCSSGIVLLAAGRLGVVPAPSCALCTPITSLACSKYWRLQRISNKVQSGAMHRCVTAQEDYTPFAATNIAKVRAIS